MTLLGNSKPSLTDMAYQEIRNNILSGTYTVGYKLVVNDLVAEWNISNTPIKEALNRLVTEGLVEFEPRRGMRVRRQLTGKEVREKYELRGVLEEHCCRKAAKTVADHPEVLEEMAAILAKTRVMLTDEKNSRDLYGLDERFHRLIVSLSGNDEITRQFEQLNSSILTFGLMASKAFPLRRQGETCDEHQKILDALTRRDTDALVNATRAHLENSVSHLLNFYNSTSGRLKRS